MARSDAARVRQRMPKLTVEPPLQTGRPGERTMHSGCDMLRRRRQASIRKSVTTALRLFSLAAVLVVCDGGKDRLWRDVGEEAGARGLTRMVTFQDMAFVLGGRGNSMSCDPVAADCPVYFPVAAPMLMFDVGSNSFTVLNSSAGVDYSPPVREDFGMAISGDRIFAYGGRRRGGLLVDGHVRNLPVGDLLMFSLSNFTWTPLCNQADCSSVSQ